jgi:hypothetical protein
MLRTLRSEENLGFVALGFFFHFVEGVQGI